ncbi:hypothetical protein ACN20G_05065 [Streptomyces sp. BI20]|uniref:hypothetical protein n=1 Tax=Streptomyces sp. BI20 TaxID=3403460 RepID=UPI003C781483
MTHVPPPSAADADRLGRRRAEALAPLLRHAPDAVSRALLAAEGPVAVDPATRRRLCRDQPLPAGAVTLLLREGTDRDRELLARNPYVLGRPLPGLPGAARYAAAERRGRRTAPAGRPAADPGRSTALLRAHGGARPRGALAVLRAARAAGVPLDPAALLPAHATAPLPTGAVEAVLLLCEPAPDVALALLARPGRPTGRDWRRPAVRAVRSGLLTPEELVRGLPAALRDALWERPGPRARGPRWNLDELAEYRGAVTRVTAETGAGTGTPRPDRRGPDPVPGVDRELALAELSLPHPTLAEDLAATRRHLDLGLITGADVLRSKVPGCWALDEAQWLGTVDRPDRFDRPAAVLAARAEADRLLGAGLGTDPVAWWCAARALPEFVGTLPELLDSLRASGRR